MFYTELTARNYGLAPSVKAVLPKLLAEGMTTAIDYGAGWLRNTKCLLANGFKMHIVDTPTQLKRIGHLPEIKLLAGVYPTNNIPLDLQVDFALLTYVLNIVFRPEERHEIIKNIYEVLKPKGYLIVEVRSQQSILEAKYIKPFGDGYQIGKHIKTFQKPYSEKELNELISPVGFKVLESRQTTRSIFILYEKEKRNVWPNVFRKSN